MQFGILERIQFIGIMPAEGNIITLRVVNELRADLGFSEEEIKSEGIKPIEGGGIQWNSDSKLMKEVNIGDTAKDVIKAALKKLNDEEKLTPPLVPLWDKFVS